MCVCAFNIELGWLGAQAPPITLPLCYLFYSRQIDFISFCLKILFLHIALARTTLIGQSITVSCSGLPTIHSLQHNIQPPSRTVLRHHSGDPISSTSLSIQQYEEPTAASHAPSEIRVAKGRYRLRVSQFIARMIHHHVRRVGQLTRVEFLIRRIGCPRHGLVTHYARLCHIRSHG